MPRSLATTLSAAGLGPIFAGLAVLAGSLLMPATSRAEGGYGPGRPDRAAPPPYAAPARRCGSPRPCHGGPYVGGPGVVHAYLPRNNAVPMYNEPPPRFPGN